MCIYIYIYICIQPRSLHLVSHPELQSTPLDAHRAGNAPAVNFGNEIWRESRVIPKTVRTPSDLGNCVDPKNQCSLSGRRSSFSAGGRRKSASSSAWRVKSPHSKPVWRFPTSGGGSRLVSTPPCPHFPEMLPPRATAKDNTCLLTPRGRRMTGSALSGRWTLYYDSCLIEGGVWGGRGAQIEPDRSPADFVVEVFWCLLGLVALLILEDT